MIFTSFNSTESVWNSLDSLLADNKYLFPEAKRVEGGVRSPNPTQRVSNAANDGQHPLYVLAEAIPRFIYIKLYHRVNNHGMYADGFYNSMIDDRDGHLPSPLFMLTCIALRHALLEWQKNKGVLPKASKSKLKADRPDHSNHFNYNNDGGKNASCCTATGRKLLTSHGVADAYAFSMNTWNALPESYQQRVYYNTLATGNGQIQEAENPMPAVVISVEAAHVDNAILVEYLTSEVALEEPEIGSTV